MKDPVILGVCNANVSGATLLVGGKVVASVNEERFSRVKNHRAFPAESIDYCLRTAGASIADVDSVACGAWAGIDEAYIPHVIDEVMEAIAGDPSARQLISDRTRVAVQRDLHYKGELLERLADLGVPRGRVRCYDHHLSHAYTAFYPSPYDEALVVTIDGRGDFKSATVSRASRDTGIDLVDSVSMYSSLGAFYGFITRYLGFTPDRHEGKVTGLAAFGDPQRCRSVLGRMITCNGQIRANVGRHYTPFATGALPEVEAALEPFSREDIAAGAQQLLEETVTTWLAPYVASTGLRNVCLAGGVFGNVKLNQRINEMPGVDAVYVFPQMGDGGNAFGGALIELYRLGGTFDHPLADVYLGPEPTEADLRGALDGCGAPLDVNPLEAYTLRRLAQEIADGAIVGLVSGRMEYGPRALGARTILARATRKDINKSLNARLHRTEFMPFAPVTLEAHATECYVGWSAADLASRFMTLCYNCTDRMAREVPGVVHIDGTARPQVISRQANPLYFDILTAYHELTGLPTLINTSFNNHEEPIVCTAEDVLASLLIDNVDAVVMGRQVIRRKRAPQRPATSEEGQ